MEWRRVETLLDADLDRLVERASDANAALSALVDKIRAEVHSVEVSQAALRDRIDEIPAKIEAERSLAAKCDAIIAKAEGEGRGDLAAAARAKKGNAEASAAALEAELVDADADLTRADEVIPRLNQKISEIEARRDQLGVADTLPAMDVPDAAPSVASAPAVAAPKPAAEAGGEADLDAEFAALMAGMDDLEDDAPTAAAADDDDDLDLALPDLVEVRDDELPEGADPEDEGPIDFSALDALAAKEAGKPAPAPAKKGGAKKGAEKKQLPAKVSGAKPPAETGDGEKRSRKGLWITVGGVAIAVGGTLAALIGFGVL